MAGTGPTDLFDVAAEILEAAVRALDEIPSFDPVLLAAPERRYVNVGVPAHDCEQLVVAIDPIAPLPAQRENRFAAWITAPTFTVETARCQPSPEVQGTKLIVPTVDALEEAARQHAADGWAIWNGLHDAVDRKEILASCDKALFDPGIVRQPAGGFGGWSFAIRVTVEGYETTAAS